VPITTYVVSSNLDQGEVKTLCDQVCQWLTTCRWFSPGPLVSSTSTTDRHDITEILLKVALNTRSRFELTTYVVIGTGYICSCKSNYHTIMATTAPNNHAFITYIKEICRFSFRWRGSMSLVVGSNSSYKAYHKYGVGSRPALKITKEGALD
jgi:hypothetical protein